jgi:transcriptional regulator with XRE-family HTH domain
LPDQASALLRDPGAKERRSAPAGFSLASLSEASGVHPMVIAKYEQGRREPSWLAALDLLRVMGKSQADLEREYDAGEQPVEAEPRLKARRKST